MDETAIRQLILRKLSQGELPSPLPRATWGGTCVKVVRCSACDETIVKGEMEVEADCADGRTRHYHATCHRLVEAERLLRA
jgi:hypothetical protein